MYRLHRGIHSYLDEIGLAQAWWNGSGWTGSPTYYVDAVNGDDGGDGLTPAAAKATIAAGMTLLAAGASGATLAVLPGTYTEGINWNTAQTANVGFVGDTILDLSGISSPNDCGFQSLAGTLNLYGPPSGYTCVIRNAGNDGLSATGGVLNAWDIDVESCYDGVSSHNGATIRTYRCNFSDCSKDAFAHVGTAIFYHEDCTFTDKTASVNGIGVTSNTASGSFIDCVMLPAPASSSKMPTLLGTGLKTLTRTKIGTASMTGAWTADALGWQNIAATDCYFRGMRISGAQDITFTRCYGIVTLRNLATAAQNVLIENCVFKTGVSSGRMLESDYRSAPDYIGGGGTVKDSIFVSHTTAIMADAGNVSDMNTNWSFINNSFYGNTTNMTAGLTADGTDITSDPLLVDTTTDEQSGWKYSASSPCIGAGTGGGNIGIGAA